MQLHFFVWSLVLLQCLSLSLSSSADSEPKFPKANLDKREECVDTRNCTWIRVVYRLNTQEKLEDFCEKYKAVRLVKQCKNTCGHCKLPHPPAPEPLKCEDERDCSALIHAHKGDRAALDEYCDTYKNDPAIKECRYTCGFCKAPAPERECKDERSDCNWIVENNKGEGALDEYCARYRNDPAVEKCRKTCRFCKAPNPPEPIECKDERSDCNWIVENNKGEGALDEYCARYRNEPGVKMCKKTCGFCKAPAPPAPTKAPEPAKVCKDTRVGGCSWIKERNDNPAEYCEAWKEDEAVKQCQKTCGFCK